MSSTLGKSLVVMGLVLKKKLSLHELSFKKSSALMSFNLREEPNIMGSA